MEKATKFNVGDKVKVRKWEDMANEFGVDGAHTIHLPWFSFIPQMRLFCGREVIIRMVMPHGYLIEGDRCNWSFDEECFERKEENKPRTCPSKYHRQIVYMVYYTLCDYVGEENAVSAEFICRVNGIRSHRELRKIIREIRRSPELEKFPCSCSKGYYMASTKEEAKKAIDRLINAAKNEFKTGYIMMKKLGLDKQMKILLDEFCSDTYHSLVGDDNETNTEAD